MSSTSSSECICDQYWPNYETGYNTNYRSAFGSNPYYPAMGHPLVYYAQAPRPRNLTHRGRDRERGSPNCFVKAFRWYTKEHLPNRSQSPTKPDMTGFATWLDVKYDEFLQESQLGSEMYHVKLKQTLEAERVPTDNYCEPCTPKKIAAMSRWKKKRRARSSDTGTVRQKSSQSCRYIMQPKDVSRHPSVCCHPSNITTTISECAKKPITTSQSFSNVTLIIKGNEPCPPRCETPAIANVGDNKPNTNVCQNSTCKYINSKQSAEKIQVSPKNKTTTKQDFGCQFGAEITTKVNAETQYVVAVPPNSKSGSYSSNQRIDDCECPGPEKQMTQKHASRDAYITTYGAAYSGTLRQPVLPYDLNTSECTCKSLDTVPRRPMSKNSSRHSQRKVKSKSSNNVECQCPEEKIVTIDAQTQYVPRTKTCVDNNICECDFKGFMRNIQAPVQSLQIPSNNLPLCACERKINEEIATERITFAQTTSQTSNYSICLEKETVHEYPLFLRIVCADKLSKENIK